LYQRIQSVIVRPNPAIRDWQLSRRDWQLSRRDWQLSRRDWQLSRKQ